jgi:hypothetical protein
MNLCHPWRWYELEYKTTNSPRVRASVAAAAAAGTGAFIACRRGPLRGGWGWETVVTGLTKGPEAGSMSGPRALTLEGSGRRRNFLVGRWSHGLMGRSLGGRGGPSQNARPALARQATAGKWEWHHATSRVISGALGVLWSAHRPHRVLQWPRMCHVMHISAPASLRGGWTSVPPGGRR